MKVRAAVLEAMGAEAPYAKSKPLKIWEVELKPPGPGEILVKMGAAGLCHSDLSVINGDRPRPVPMALGHEAAGVVHEVGPGVDDLVKAEAFYPGWLPQLLTNLYPAAKTDAVLTRHRQEQSSDELVERYFTPALKALAQKIYQLDFETFGYGA